MKFDIPFKAEYENMEVSGKKLFSERESTPCKPCENRDCYTRSDGFCGQCDEYKCNTCFDTHKQFKVSKGHTLTIQNVAVAKKEETENFVKCQHHFKEMIKFHCYQHKQVGCGDCMILEHNTCTVEHIHDKASNFKNSEVFKNLVEGADICHQEAKETLSSIKNDKVQVLDINEKFNRNVNTFKEEMIAHITEMTNAMLKLGEKIKTIDIKTMEELENENEIMMDEISKLTTEIESQIDKPNKLFAIAVLQKPKLEKLRFKLQDIKNRCKIELYEFERDENIDRSVKGCKELGHLQRIKQRKETELHEEVNVRQKKTTQKLQASVPPKVHQALLDRQLIFRNITVDGEYLSYMYFDNGKGDDGLYVNKKELVYGSYFEADIVNTGERGTIAIGVVRYAGTEKQEWRLRFQASDGKLYVGDNPRENTGKICSVGDRIGCGLKQTYGFWGKYRIVFTRNGKMIGQFYIDSDHSYHAAIGMHSAKEQVRVMLDAKMPNV